MSQGQERRTQRRLPFRMLVQFRLHDMNEFNREHAVNISEGGMFIRTTEPHPEGSVIFLQFAIDGGAKLIEGLGRVVHVNPPGHPAPGMGVEFVNLDLASRTLISGIVNERTSELEA